MMRRGLRNPCSHLVDPTSVDSASSSSVAGDVHSLDRTAAQIFARALADVDCVARLSLSTVRSEGLGDGGTGRKAGGDGVTSAEQYEVVVDPLDGANNADSGTSVGSIFGVYRTPQPATADGELPSARVGLVAAGYAMYGAAGLLVISTGEGLHGFTRDESLGEFVLTRPHIRTPSRGRTYSVNMGLRGGWDERTRAYVDSLSEPPDPKSGSQPAHASSASASAVSSRPARSLRYIGTMVADVHRTLLYGGIFLYPGDRKSPNGKLLLVHEAGPMAFLAQQAGASADTGGGVQLLDVKPSRESRATPVVIGSRDDVIDYLRFVGALPLEHGGNVACGVITSATACTPADAGA